MNPTYKYGDVLRPKDRFGGGSFSRGGDQRVQFVRYLTNRERSARQSYGAIEFIGLTVRGSSRPLGEHKVGSLEFFEQHRWALDE